MKKILLLTFAIAIISCKKETPIDYAIISGTITNANSDKLTLSNQFSFGDRKEVMLKENGVFVDTVKIGNSNSYTLYQKRNAVNLFLNKGDNLTLNFDAKNLDSTLVILGKGNVVNNYLAKRNKTAKQFREGTKKLYSKNEEGFLNAIKKLKKEQDNVLSTASISDDLKKLETKDINYQYLSLLNNYENYHGYFTKNEKFKASEGFFNDLKGVDFLNEENFKYSSNYRNLVASHFQEKSETIAKKDSLAQDIALLKTIAAIDNQTIKNNLLHQNAVYGITYTENLEDFYKIFSGASTDEKNNTEIAAIYGKLKALSKGSPSPKFTNYENNAGGKTSLEDLKGKYVYIDVWATWCGPCIGEIPSLKKVEKKYHNKNIKFVSISVDNKKDYDKWKKMIVDKKLGGIQLFSEDSWKSKFVEGYMIKGIPRFILIDPQGNIISANAPRPSDSKLIDLFNEYKI